jgi:oligogalacturonide lyase
MRAGASVRRFTRRVLLPTLPLLGTELSPFEDRGATLEPQRVRFLDEATEFEVHRLTSPSDESRLPAVPARAVSRDSKSLLLASTRTGRWQALWMEIASGAARVLTDGEALDPESLTLSPDSRTAYLFRGPELTAVPLSGTRESKLYSVREGWQRSGPLAMAEDNQSLYFAECSDRSWEVRRVRAPRGAAETLARAGQPITAVTPNPRRALALWQEGGASARVGGLDGTGNRELETPPGRLLQAQWSADGNSVLYLLEPAEAGHLNEIREQDVDSRADRLVARTSQYMAFSRNANGSVFIGASRNRAAPDILLLLRMTRREFTLCEHGARDARLTAPQFTPNSQRVLFQSDREGKMAIYEMAVDKLLEKTGD